MSYSKSQLQNQKIIDNQQGHGNIITPDLNTSYGATPQSTRTQYKASKHTYDVPREHTFSQQLLSNHLHGSDPIQTGKFADIGPDKYPNMRGIDCTMRIPDQKNLLKEANDNNIQKERNHNTWKSDNTKKLLNWNENPSNPEKNCITNVEHRVRNHNTWLSHNNDIIDPQLPKDDSDNHQLANLPISNKISTIVKSKQTYLNTSITNIKDYSDRCITPEKRPKISNVNARRNFLRSHLTDELPITHGEYLADRKSDNNTSILAELNRDNEERIVDHKNHNTRYKCWKTTIDGQPLAKKYVSEEVDLYRNYMKSTQSKKHKEADKYTTRPKTRTSLIMKMNQTAEREQPLLLKRRAWE